MTEGQVPGAGEMLLAHLEASGAVRVETSVLQPADLFVDLSGEDIRRRLFLTQDASGRELCLRPEYTIPVCREHVGSGRARGEYCYLGPVFRQRDDGAAEFLQVGIESIGRDELCPADADLIGLALEGYELAFGERAEIRLGDMSVLSAILDGLAVPPRLRRRLVRTLAAGHGHAAALDPDPAQDRAPAYAGLLAAIEGQDPGAARAFVEDVLSISGVAEVGGRSAAEIADRFLSRAENRSGALPDRARTVLARYLAISSDLDGAAREMRRLAREERLDLGRVLDLFEERTGFVAARGVDLGRIRFAADFVRTLDYYTGFIFEIREAGSASYRVAGGRYDGLLAHLGAAGPVPAVGCSFWLDRPGLERGGAVVSEEAGLSDGPLVIAVPSKGRLQENAAAFFARAGLPVSQARGARDYRGSLGGLPDAEVRFLSAAEIAAQLAIGAVHLGVTGEDLLRESVPGADVKLELVTGLGFGFANVVVAVPQSWIDVRVMADLAEVADEIRARHGRRIRVATKYVNLTRGFFAERGIADYRIVESLGATEAAPQSGSADLIVDITTTGATLAANGLRVLDDGIILKSEANLVASLVAPWGGRARGAVAAALARIAAEEEARTQREIRAGIEGTGIEPDNFAATHSLRRPRGRGAAGGELVLHCPTDRVFEVVAALVAAGAQDIGVARLDYVFRAESTLIDRLFRRFD